MDKIILKKNYFNLTCLIKFVIKNEKLRDVGRNGTIEVQLTLLSDKEKILLLKYFLFSINLFRIKREHSLQEKKNL